MPGDIGLVAKLTETVFSWFTDEAGFKEFRKRRELNKLREAAVHALHDRRWDDLRRISTELERLCNAP